MEANNLTADIGLHAREPMGDKASFSFVAQPMGCFFAPALDRSLRMSAGRAGASFYLRKDAYE